MEELNEDNIANKIRRPREHHIAFIRNMIFGYCDDIMLLFTNKEHLKQIIKRTKEWSLKNKLDLNLKQNKTNIMFFKKKRVQTETQYEDIIITNRYKYLGITLENNNTFDTEAKYILQQLGNYKNIFLIDKAKLSTAAAKAVFQAYFNSKIIYHLAPLHNMSKTKQIAIQRKYNMLIKKLLKFPKFQNPEKLNKFYGFPSIEDMYAKYKQRIDQKNDVQTD